jgi:hypothetical protein
VGTHWLKDRELGLTISGPELLTAVHDLTEFCCGKLCLDRWPETRALSNQEKGFTAVLAADRQQRMDVARVSARASRPDPTRPDWRVTASPPPKPRTG